MYKIVTLGESFLFITPKERLKKMQFREGTHAVKIFLDDEFEYNIEPIGKGFFLPDLYRALLVYIYKIKGFPKSDYEAKILPSNSKIVLESNGLKIGGNVGKCKLKLLNVEDKSLLNRSYEVSVGEEKCVVVRCDNVHSFDEKVLRSLAYRSEVAKYCHVFAAVSFSSYEVSARVITLPAFSRQSLSVSLAAMHFCLSNVFGVEKTLISIDENKALCESDARDVFVYDTAPESYVLFE